MLRSSEGQATGDCLAAETCVVSVRSTSTPMRNNVRHRAAHFGASRPGCTGGADVPRSLDGIVARPDELALVRRDDGLDAVTEPELAEDMRNVRLGGVLAQAQSIGDLPVRPAAGDE